MLTVVQYHYHHRHHHHRRQRRWRHRLTHTHMDSTLRKIQWMNWRSLISSTHILSIIFISMFIVDRKPQTNIQMNIYWTVYWLTIISGWKRNRRIVLMIFLRTIFDYIKNAPNWSNVYHLIKSTTHTQSQTHRCWQRHATKNDQKKHIFEVSPKMSTVGRSHTSKTHLSKLLEEEKNA